MTGENAMNLAKIVLLILAAVVASGGVLATSGDADAHDRRKSKGAAQATRSDKVRAGGADDGRMSDGDYFLSCKGFVPDFGGETSCGPAVDLGDE
jgi:hypothetical protein